MSLRLTILRHAHASDAAVGTQDFDRPLSAAGREAALALGNRFRDALESPDRLRVSPALRTRETAQRVGAAAFPALSLDLAPALYLASLGTLLKEIAATPASCRHLMIVGHNPGLSELWAVVGDEPGFPGLAPCEWRSRAFDSPDWTSIR